MPVRLLVSAFILIAALLVLFLFLLATDTALSVWSQLKEAPVWIQAGYVLILLGATASVVALSWRWFRPGRKKKSTLQSGIDNPVPEFSAQELETELVTSSKAGIDVSAALSELKEQRKRREGGELHIAVFGEISSGKSSLVKAILPHAEIATDPRGGTTTSIVHHTWTSPSGDSITIADLPGFNLESSQEAVEECRRAHLVVFLCDSDLTASQVHQLEYLRQLNKPLVLALNKLDRFSQEEQSALMDRIRERSGLPEVDVVGISTRGRSEVVQKLGADVEQSIERTSAPEIAPLLTAVQTHLDQNRGLMESLQDTAVLLLATEKLNLARNQHRDNLADELVTKYARRAVVGAMAAVAPGTDLIIQGVLGTQLIRELSRIFEVPVKDMEIESFLKMAGSKVRNMTAISLAIAGNALKAFPGMGTLTGGLVHAVAYGMIFDSLGRAACATLASRGALRPLPAAEAFEELLHERLEEGAVRFVQMALTEKGVDQRREKAGRKPDDGNN
jgi:GTP-binding protein EngB required for normal cell division